MVILYNLIFLLFAIVQLPVYLFKGKFHKGFSARLGKLPKNLNLDKPIWVHAVSVGEAASVAGLIDELRKQYPQKQFVISTVTPTGNKIARKIAAEKDFVTYLPLDLSWIVKSTIDRLDPSLFVIAETEIWPNLILYLDKKRIPVAIVNGRISDKSYKGYIGIGFLIKPILDKVGFVCAQSERDAQRFIDIGMPSAKVACCGNMKFDTAKDLRVQDQAKTRSLLHLSKDERLFVAGSTHPKEEEMVLGAYRKLMDSSPGLRLLIAPRHPERAHEIFGIIKRAGFDSMRVSKLGNEKPRHNKVVFILDTIGQLLNFYNIADAIFVGGSLVKKGGHNPLEPAALAKTAVFGPHMFNFRDISELLLEARAMTVAHDEEHLSGCIEILLKDPIMAGEMGERALELIRKNQGATLKCADRIKSLARNTL